MVGPLVKGTEVCNVLHHQPDEPVIVFFSESSGSYYTCQTCPSEMKEREKIFPNKQKTEKVDHQ